MSNSAGRIEITENTLLKLLIRRGSNTERANVILSEGELGYTVDTRRLFVGDGVTAGGSPTSLFLYFGTGHPSTWAAEAEAGDVAYDSIAGGIYRLNVKPYTVSGNWTLFSGPLANRVDGETLQLNATTGVMSVNTVSAAQLDVELAGLGLEFNGTRELQTTANQEFDAIDTRDNAYIQLPQAIQFSTAGGAAVFNMPAFDGAAGSVLTTDSFGNLVFTTPGTYQTQYMVLSSNQVPVGSIVPYGSGGNFNATSSVVPHGYFLCDGSTKNGTTYSALCAVIGQYYGGTAPNFNVPLLTASNFVYIIKYLEDVIFTPSTVALDNVTLTAYDATNAESTATLVFPNSGIQYQLGINDYISKTQVDSQIDSLCATIDFLLTRDQRYVERFISPAYNCGISQINYQHSFILDAANNVRGAGNSDTTAGTVFGVGNSNLNYDFYFPMAVGLSANEYAISAFSVGNMALLLTNEGNVYGCGLNAAGMLGLSSTNTDVYVQLNPLDFNNEKVTQLVSSYANNNDTTAASSVYAITESGNLYGWGSNDAGELGRGNTTAVLSPKKLNAPYNDGAGNYTSISAAQIKKVVTGGFTTGAFTFVIDANDHLHACGCNSQGALGLGDTVTPRTLFNRVTTYTELSSNYNDTATEAIQVEYPSGILVDDVYAGGYDLATQQSYIIRGGLVWAAGINTSRSLGINSTTTTIEKTSFVPVSGLNSTNAVPRQLSGVDVLSIGIIDTNGCSVAAILQDKSMVVWGDNANARLGINSNTTDQERPIRPSAPFTGIKKVQFLQGTQFILTTAGDMYTIGLNADGVCGNGTTTSPLQTKTKVINIQRDKFEDFIAVGASTNRSVYAYTTNPTRPELYAWGRNANGQLGFSSSITPVLVPIRVPL